MILKIECLDHKVQLIVVDALQKLIAMIAKDLGGKGFVASEGNGTRILIHSKAGNPASSAMIGKVVAAGARVMPDAAYSMAKPTEEDRQIVALSMHEAQALMAVPDRN